MHFRDAATRVLDEPTGKALLAEYSIATTRGVVVLTPSAAAPQVRQSELRFPLAAKLISPDAIPTAIHLLKAGVDFATISQLFAPTQI